MSTALPATAADPAPRVVGAACGSGGGVTVVVDYTPVLDTVDVRCATPTPSMTIGEAFAATGFHLNDMSFADTVDGVFANWADAAAPAYWSLLMSTANGQPSGSPATDWTPGQVGLGAGPAHDGQAYLLEYMPLDPLTMADIKTSPVLTLASVLGHVTATPVTPPSNGPGAADAQAAAGWLGRQLAANKDILPYAGGTDWGLTVDALLGLASAGVGGDQIAATAAKLAASGDAYVGTPAQASANAAKTAKLVFGLEVAGLDPTTFGGSRDLVAELRGTIADDGAIGASATAFTQSYGLLALARTGGGAPAAAVSWLQAQQCTTGANAGAYGWSASCSSADQDTTAIVAQALLAAGVPATDPAVASAEAWLIASQDASGGVASSMGGVNTNTTGVTAQLLRAAPTGGSQAALTAAAGYIGGLQITSAGIAAHKKLTTTDAGAIAYDAAGLDDATTYGIDATLVDQFRRASAQALLGLGGPAMGSLTAAGAAASLPAGPAPTGGPTPAARPTASPSAAPASSPTSGGTPAGGKTVGTGGTLAGLDGFTGPGVVLLASALVAFVLWRRARS